MTKQKEVIKEASTLEERYNNLSIALKEGWKGVITEVTPCRSREFFGTDTYDDREGYKVNVKISEKDGNEFSQFFSFPDIRGIQKSNIYAFEQKYNSVPKEGLEVEVILNENGFFEIVF